MCEVPVGNVVLRREQGPGGEVRYSLVKWDGEAWGPLPKGAFWSIDKAEMAEDLRDFGRLYLFDAGVVGLLAELAGE